MHPRDRLHHPAVAICKTHAINVLHPSDVRGAVARDRNARVALDCAGHAGRPEELITDLAVDELVQVAQVLHQLPGLVEGRRDELDQRLGVVRRDAFVGERRAQRPWVRALGDLSIRPDPKRLLLHALETATQRTGGVAVDEASEASLVGAVKRHTRESNVGIFLRSFRRSCRNERPVRVTGGSRVTVPSRLGALRRRISLRLCAIAEVPLQLLETVQSLGVPSTSNFFTTAAPSRRCPCGYSKQFSRLRIWHESCFSKREGRAMGACPFVLWSRERCVSFSIG